MYKIAAPAQHHPTNRTLTEFHRYWGESHGPMYANTARLRRYVQHLTLPEAYGIDPTPTYDGISIFWVDEFFWKWPAVEDPRADDLARATREDDAQLFDRIVEWPTHHKKAVISATESVIVDGAPEPEMVKAILVVAKRPGLSLHEFSDHWRDVHGPIAAGLPGLRRYVQNHPVAEAYVTGNQTHDGWSELWFDDLAGLQRAARSPAWAAMVDDAESLFSGQPGVVIARERVQKDLDWRYDDWGVGALSDEAIRDRLRRDGYRTLAENPAAPATIRAAAAIESLAVWTEHHLVTIDDSHIDTRPDR